MRTPGNPYSAVRLMRHKTRLNQSAFWGRIGVTQSGGSRYETGRPIPNPVKLLLTLAHGTPKEARTLFDKLRGKA